MLGINLDKNMIGILNNVKLRVYKKWVVIKMVRNLGCELL